MRRSIDLDMECWFCEAPIAREEVERDAHLVPRRRDQGGPYYLHRCPDCTRQCRVERNRAGALLATPLPIVPVVDPILATFDADLRAELERKREHERRRGGSRREWFFGAYADELWSEGVRPRGTAPPRPEPAPRRRRARTAPPDPGPARAAPEPEPAPPPPPPPEPVAPPPPPPEPTPWEVLGLDEGASPEDVQRAFRELARRYHPDRFEALDEDFRALAEAKFVRLKAAYDSLSEGRPDR